VVVVSHLQDFEIPAQIWIIMQMEHILLQLDGDATGITFTGIGVELGDDGTAGVTFTCAVD
jgi:hypothetical protein